LNPQDEILFCSVCKLPFGQHKFKRCGEAKGISLKWTTPIKTLRNYIVPRRIKK
jgi:hypothetical protein